MSLPPELKSLLMGRGFNVLNLSSKPKQPIPSSSSSSPPSLASSTEKRPLKVYLSSGRVSVARYANETEETPGNAASVPKEVVTIEDLLPTESVTSQSDFCTSKPQNSSSGDNDASSRQSHDPKPRSSYGKRWTPDEACFLLSRYVAFHGGDAKRLSTVIARPSESEWHDWDRIAANPGWRQFNRSVPFTGKECYQKFDKMRELKRNRGELHKIILQHIDHLGLFADLPSRKARRRPQNDPSDPSFASSSSFLAPYQPPAKRVCPADDFLDISERIFDAGQRIQAEQHCIEKSTLTDMASIAKSCAIELEKLASLCQSLSQK